MTVNKENTQDLFKLIKVAPESQKLNAESCKHHNVTNVKSFGLIFGLIQI